MRRKHQGRGLRDPAGVAQIARFPDRDQLFETGNKAIPPVADDREGWGVDDEPRLENRGDPRDAVDALRSVDRIADRHEADGPPRDARPTPSPRAGGGRTLGSLDEAELRRRAEVLGIAGRQEMTRAQLVRAMMESSGPTA